MDRLVCGDVGFGKTEVAVRAAFKAVTGGRQVLVLVPTTVLAQQHAARSATASATSRCGSRWSRGSGRRPRSRRCWPTSARARWTS